MKMRYDGIGWDDGMGWDQMGIRLFRQMIEGVLLDTLEMEIGMELVHFTMQLNRKHVG